MSQDFSKQRDGSSALVWLRSRELLGESRDPLRLYVLGIATLVWVLVVILAAVKAAQTGRIHPDIDARYVTAAAWPLWALVPILGGGGGEVVSARRLAPYPISASAVFAAGWVNALTDIPYLVVAPLVLGMGAATAGWAGLLIALLFIASASATGQLASWLSFGILSSRKRSGVSALVLTGVLVGVLAVVPHLARNDLEAGGLLPGGWAYQALIAASGHQWHTVARWAVFLLLPLPIAAFAGAPLTRRALDLEARAAGVTARAWGHIGVAARGSVLRMLTLSNLRSIFRAVGAQVALAGVLAVPAITQLPGINALQISLLSIGGVAGLAAAVSLGVNSFAFDAGGASLLLSMPVRARDVIWAKALAVATLLFASQLAATMLGYFTVSDASPREFALCLIRDVARTLILTGTSMVWSVRFPASSDYDSLRARIAAPHAVVSFLVASAAGTYFVSQGSHDLPGFLGSTSVLVAAALLGLGLGALATSLLTLRGTERVADAVVG